MKLEEILRESINMQDNVGIEKDDKSSLTKNYKTLLNKLQY